MIITLLGILVITYFLLQYIRSKEEEDEDLYNYDPHWDDQDWRDDD